MGPVAWMTMLATVVAVAVAWLARKRVIGLWAFGCSLAIAWVLLEGLHQLVGPDCRKIYPPMDFAMAVTVCVGIVKQTGRLDLRCAAAWQQIALVAIVSQAILHVFYPTYLPLEVRYPYLVAHAVLYAVQIVAAVMAGGRHARDAVVDWLAARSVFHSAGHEAGR